MTDIICPRCGKKQDESFKFCKSCGKSLHDEMEYDSRSTISNLDPHNVKICPECGTGQNSEFKFCKNCGAPLPDEDIKAPVIVSKYEHKKENETSKFSSNDDVESENEEPHTDSGKPAGMKLCPKCGHEIEEGNFCSHCGYRINQNVKTCSSCGSQIEASVKFCPDCGAKVIQKNPLAALVLSLLFPGLGQLYNNQNHKGLTLIIGYIVSLILSLLLVGVILVILIWIYGMYDAFVSANAINEGELIEDRLF